MKKDFSKGSVKQHIMLQAIPLTIAQLIHLLYNIIDRIYIGHLGHAHGEALTGIGVVFPFITITMAFTNMFSGGGTPLFSIARGAKRREDAGRILNETFLLLCGMGVILMGLGYLFHRPLLYLFGAGEHTYRFAREYLLIYLIGTVFNMVGTGMSTFINAQGYAKTGMGIVIVGAVLNIILDPVFIFSMHMGIRGAAIATVISQFVTFALVILVLTGEKVGYGLHVEKMRLVGSDVREICGLGLSGFMMEITNSLVQILCNGSLRHYGGEMAVGIMTVLNSVREIANVAIHGITNGAQPVISYNYGAKKWKRVREAILFMSVIGGLYTTFVWGLIQFFPDFFIRLFSDQTALLTAGRSALRLYFLGFFFMSFQFAGQSSFVALGKSMYAVFFSILRKVLIVVPLTLLLPRLFGMGVTGVYIAEPISNMLGGLACFITMVHVVWKELKEKERGNSI